MKKRNIIALIIGCFLISSNLGIAVGITYFSESETQLLSDNLTKEIVENDILTPEKETINLDEDITTEEVINQNDATEEEEEDSETIINENTPSQPIIFTNANAGGPYFGEKGQSITFHATGTIIVIGSTYEWDFGDDNDFTTGYGLNPSHIYDREGIYYATLKVTRPNGDTYLDIATVYIDQEGDDLVPYGGCSYEAEKNEQITFDASESTGTSGAELKYRWDFGDGDGFTDWSNSPTITHSYDKERVYLVDLEVKDQYGNKVRDVIHADIGTSFTSVKDLFVNGDGLISDVVELLMETEAYDGTFFCQWLGVKIYTKYNDIVKETPIINFQDASGKKIDVNNDGTDDVQIGGIEWFKTPDSPRTSPFDSGIRSYQFETTLYGAQILYSGSIEKDDDFTICLQFTFPGFITNLLGLAEPTVKIGFHMPAGEDKTYQQISVKHMFRPFLLAKLGLLSGNSYPYNLYTPLSTTYVQNSQTYYPLGTTTYPQNVQNYETTNIGTTEIVTPSVTDTTIVNDVSTVGTVANTQQQTPIVPSANSGIYPEHGLMLEGINGETIGLVGIVEKTDYTTTLEIKFESLFTPFTLTHRRGEAFRDVDLSGQDSSSVTFSINRQYSNGRATLGMLINPIEPTGFHLDIRKVDDERQLDFVIDTPPENVVMFFETEDITGELNGNYIYMKYIPEIIGLKWLPRLDDGYIKLENGGSEQFEIGISDDLENPESKIYFSNIPASIEFNWEIILGDTRTVTLSTDISGITLNADLQNNDKSIDFKVTPIDPLDVTFSWNVQGGYFSIDRSTRSINFDLMYSSSNLNLLVDGQYTIGEGDGLTINLNGLESGLIELETGKTLSFNVVLDIIQPEEVKMRTRVEFQNAGKTKLQWDLEQYSNSFIHFESEGTYVKFSDFDLNFLTRTFDVDFDSLILPVTSNFYLDLETDGDLSLGSLNRVETSNFNIVIKKWTGSLYYGKSEGSFDITFQPNSRYYELDMGNKLQLEDFYIAYDADGTTYDTVFSVDDFLIQYGGKTWFKYESSKYKFEIEGNNDLSLTNLDLKIGSGLTQLVDFSIPSFSIGGVGSIYAELNNQYLYVDADVDFDWDVQIETLYYGDWELDGTFSGSASMTLNEWTVGQSGQITFQVNSPIYHSLQIIHGGLTLDLGNIDLNTGSISFDWKRDYPGHVYITNTLSGTVNLFKINYQNQFEIELGTITLGSGSVDLDWYESSTSNKKTYILDNSANLEFDLIEISSGTKSISLGALDLSSGQFKLEVTGDSTKTTISVYNSIQGFGPELTYEDTSKSLELGVSLTNLNSDISKGVTLVYDETLKKISVDSNNNQIAQWLQFEIIKNNVGRRLAINGLQVDNFYIDLDDNGHWQSCGGKIYFANQLVYSKLINNEWEDLTITWDLQSELKVFTFDSEFDLTVNLVSLEIIGVNFNSYFDITDHLEVKWKLTGTSSEYKEFHFDTDGEVLSSLVFEIIGPNDIGVKIEGGGVWAQNFYVKWKLLPPGSNLIIGGTIGYNWVDIYGTLNGGTSWIKIWGQSL